MHRSVGIVGRIARSTGIGAGVTAASAAIGNAMGPEGGLDGGMHYYERAAAIAQWHPTDVGTAALVGGAIGLGVGIARRHKEMKEEQAQHEALSKRQFRK